jgi:FKBP-type peptidyl-prolyl cis-trans isomerase FkpA
MRKSLPLLTLAFGVAAVVSCNHEITGLEPPSNPATETFAASLGVNISAMTKTTSGVWYLDVTPGTGIKDSAKTDSITINYTGRIKTGAQFDAATSVTFEIGRIVVGMRDGLLGMKEGGKRKIVIPSSLGYGAQAIRDTNGAIKIPRQSTLIFDIDLIKVYNHVDTTKTAIRTP